MTNDGLLEDALIRPHDPFSKVNLIPFVVSISFIDFPIILTFQQTWDDFIQPLIYLHDEDLQTLSLGLFRFRALPGQGSILNQMMAQCRILKTIVFQNLWTY